MIRILTSALPNILVVVVSQKAGESNGGYHYLGAAKILAPIGQAFAEVLLNK